MKTKGRWVWINGRECQLTRTEYELFQWMRMHQGDVVFRDTLLRSIWELPEEADTRSVDMCIRRLRVKIGGNAIQTVYGKGYILNL